MRLLHTKKLSLEEFFDSKIPKYAILSHRWEDDEVSLQDFEEGKKRDGAGFSKILRCCSLARSEGYEWVWIDTCCIDKKSSADLSEAINSMFRWYVSADICYAYLSDVQLDWVNGSRVAVGFKESKWFTRGWTLQELLAPRQVLFLDRSWEAIGTQNGHVKPQNKIDLSQSISQITGIPVEILRPSFYPTLDRLKTSSVAQRMSWAAGRETSRIEDTAYCLMGIFDVNMPLLYGEGQRAFIRLQQEIARHSKDESLFTWSPGYLGFYGLFAPSPDCFAECGNVRRTHYISWIEDSPFIPTDVGIQMEVNLIRLSNDLWLLPLNCVTEKPRHSISSKTKSQRNAILLHKFGLQGLCKVHSRKLYVIEDPHLEDILEQYQKMKTSAPLGHPDTRTNLPPRVHSFGKTYIDAWIAEMSP